MYFSSDEKHQINAWNEHLDPCYVSQDFNRNQIKNDMIDSKKFPKA